MRCSSRCPFFVVPDRYSRRCSTASPASTVTLVSATLFCSWRDRIPDMISARQAYHSARLHKRRTISWLEYTNRRPSCLTSASPPKLKTQLSADDDDIIGGASGAAGLAPRPKEKANPAGSFGRGERISSPANHSSGLW